MATKPAVDERSLVLTVVANCDEGEGVNIQTTMQRTGITEMPALKKAVKGLIDEGLIVGSSASGTYCISLTEKGQKYCTKHGLYDAAEEEETAEADAFDDAFGDAFDEPTPKAAPKAKTTAATKQQEAKLFDTTKSAQAKTTAQKAATPAPTAKQTGTPARPAAPPKPAAAPVKGSDTAAEKPAIRALSSMSVQELAESHAHWSSLAEALFENGDPIGCEGLMRSASKARKYALRTFGVDLAQQDGE